MLSQEPCPLSQMVLLSLVQQLAAGLESSSPPAGGGSAAAGKALGTQLAWIREAAMLINPRDPVLSQHFRPVLEQVGGWVRVGMVVSVCACGYVGAGPQKVGVITVVRLEVPERRISLGAE